jgi:hypothetical protein
MQPVTLQHGPGSTIAACTHDDVEGIGASTCYKTNFYPGAVRFLPAAHQMRRYVAQNAGSSWKYICSENATRW